MARRLVVALRASAAVTRDRAARPWTRSPRVLATEAALRRSPPPRARPAIAALAFTGSLSSRRRKVSGRLCVSTIDDRRLNNGQPGIGSITGAPWPQKLEAERNQPCGGVDPPAMPSWPMCRRYSCPGCTTRGRLAPPDLKPLLDGHNAERATVGGAAACLERAAPGVGDRLGRSTSRPSAGSSIRRARAADRAGELATVAARHEPGGQAGRVAGEKSDFVPGPFPDVSLSGDWQFIAHYSQMLWPGTTDLGCGVASGSGFDWLVWPSTTTPAATRTASRWGSQRRRAAGRQPVARPGSVRARRRPDHAAGGAALQRGGEFKRTGRVSASF